MKKKWFIKGFPCCTVLLARLLFLGVLVLGQTVTGRAAGHPELACEINVTHSSGDPWRDQISAVAKYVINNIQKCTGTLLNNTNNPRMPYFLTARHCFQDPQTGSDPITITVAGGGANIHVYWNYQSSSSAPYDHTVDPSNVFDETGVSVVASYDPSDFLLLQLTHPPPTCDPPLRPLRWMGCTRPG